jgi:RNA polymerase sigma-70 factor, ECF subfamily
MSDAGNNWSLWMQQTQDGDDVAYVKLLNAISKSVFGIISQKIRNNEIAEEVYQSVLLAIHRARHTYDAERPFKPWLYSITRNMIYDYLRKHRRQIALEVLVGEDFDHKASENTESAEKQLLSNALNALPPKNKEAVLLLKIKGLSMQEAADKTGISLAAMKVRAHRGYKLLKNELVNDVNSQGGEY